MSNSVILHLFQYGGMRYHFSTLRAGDLRVIPKAHGSQASILAFPALLNIAEGKEIV